MQQGGRMGNKEGRADSLTQGLMNAQNQHRQTSSNHLYMHYCERFAQGSLMDAILDQDAG